MQLLSPGLLPVQPGLMLQHLAVSKAHIPVNTLHPPQNHAITPRRQAAPRAASEDRETARCPHSPSVTIPAPQAAAGSSSAGRQMANQNPAVKSTSLTESTLKSVPQVEAKETAVLKKSRSSIPQSAAQVTHQGLTGVATNQASQVSVSTVFSIQPGPDKYLQLN
uniref:Uncharacterized protein n=1 Tax=Sphaerodactylus townsendi TaxID=933632 RepID=A0ACB8F0W6_9SAUR